MKTALCNKCEEKSICTMYNASPEEEAARAVCGDLWDIEHMINRALDNLRPLPLPVLETEAQLAEARNIVKHAMNLLEEASKN